MDLKLLRSELSRDEGRKLTAYQDTNGFWTIGVGHLLGTTRRMLTITEAECDALLNADIEVALEAVFNVFPSAGAHKGWSFQEWTQYEDVRARALVNMAFNRGETHMRDSTTITPAIRTALGTGIWANVASAILTSPWAKQIGARATRLAYMLGAGKV